MRGSIHKRGKKYSVIVTIGKDSNGKRKQKWFSGFNTKKEAEKALVKILNELENDQFIKPENTTVEEYFISWLENYVETNLRETTSSGYYTNVKNHIIPHIGKHKLQKLQPIHIQNLYTFLLKKGRIDGKGGLSAKTVLQIHRILSKALSQAYKLQLISRNPANFVEPPRKKKFKPELLDEKQIPKLINAFKDTDIYIAVILALNLGLRRGEALGLRWSDIDFDKKLLVINQTLVSTQKGTIFTEPKSEGSNRSILISDSLISELRLVRDKQKYFAQILGRGYSDLDLVCCKKDGSIIRPRRLSQIFSDNLEANGLPHIRFHDLRHLNATLMLKANIPAKIASERLGHSTIGITLDLYSHVLNEMQEDAATRLDEIIYTKNQK